MMMQVTTSIGGIERRIKKMNRYFYTVESDDSGNKVVHFVGNIYNNDDGEEQNHKIDEWTFLYFDLPELEAAIKGNTLYTQLNEATAYSDDMTEAEAQQCCEEYYGGDSGLELHISKVNKDTPFGEYWYEEEQKQ